MYKTALTAAYPITLITPMSTGRLAFRGADRKLVLAFDVGTTYSGISYRYGQTEGWGPLSLTYS